MLGTSARLLRLLTTLQMRRAWPGPELAASLDVTPRTLRRDVDKLRSLGYPVDSTPGVAGGYALAPGASVPPLHLDDEEAVAVAFALHAAERPTDAQGGATAIAKLELAAGRALAKLERVLPSRLQKRMKALRGSILKLSSGVPVELSVVLALTDACDAKRVVAFEYADREGAKTSRSVEPHRLAEVQGRWYLVAWDRSRRAWRTFRVDRVASLVRAEGAFMPRPLPDDDVIAYVTRSVGIAPYRYEAKVILHASLADLRARVTFRDGRLESVSPRRTRLTTAGHSLDTLAVWIATFDVDFEIENPPELRAHVRKMASRLRRGGTRS